jgi:peptide/nickel transport system permease protein
VLSYLIRRVLYAVPILLGVSLLTFLLYYVVVPPEIMAKRNLGKQPSREQIQSWLHEHGYDKPRIQQFGKHMSELLLLRFGNSDVNGEPVWDRIRQGAGPSFMLALPEFIASALVTISAALLVAYFRGTYLDIVAGQWLFAKVLRIFPLAGYDRGITGLKFVLLPGLVGLIAGLGGSVRYYRAAFLEEMDQDYVRTARSRGVPETQILFQHVLKNAASPILTSLVLAIPFLFMGSLLMETFFGIPGLGSITLDAINSSDFAVVRAMVFLGTALYIIGNVMTDLSYALVNPRVRLE